MGKQPEQDEQRFADLILTALRLTQRHGREFGRKLDIMRLARTAIKNGVSLNEAYEQMLRRRKPKVGE